MQADPNRISFQSFAHIHNVGEMWQNCPRWLAGKGVLNKLNRAKQQANRHGGQVGPGLASSLYLHRHRRRLSRIRPLGLFRFRIYYFLETYESIGQMVGLFGGGSARRKVSTSTQDNTT